MLPLRGTRQLATSSDLVIRRRIRDWDSVGLMGFGHVTRWPETAGITQRSIHAQVIRMT